MPSKRSRNRPPKRFRIKLAKPPPSIMEKFRDDTIQFFQSVTEFIEKFKRRFFIIAGIGGAMLVTLMAIIIRVYWYKREEITATNGDNTTLTETHQTAPSENQTLATMIALDYCNRTLLVPLWISVIGLFSSVTGFQNIFNPANKTLDFYVGFGRDLSDISDLLKRYKKTICIEQYTKQKIDCSGYIVSLHGDTGEKKWDKWLPESITQLMCQQDLNKDEHPDCVVAGKTGMLLAVDGLNGKTIWMFKDRKVYSGFVDVYSVYMTQSTGEDNNGCPNMLVLHSTGNKTTEMSGRLLIVNSCNGNILHAGRLSGPYGLSMDFLVNPPVLMEYADGEQLLLVTTGTVELPGGIFSVSLRDIDNEELFKKSIKNIFYDNRGISAAPILIDLDGDGIDEVLFAGSDMVVLLSQAPIKTKWSTDLRDIVKTNYQITILRLETGYFNEDDVQDVAVIFHVGYNFPSYHYAGLIMIDGKTGEPLAPLTIHSDIINVAGIVRVKLNPRLDLLVYWALSCEGYETYQEDPFIFAGIDDMSESKIQYSADLCAIRFNTTTKVYLYGINVELKSPGMLISGPINMETNPEDMEEQLINKNNEEKAAAEKLKLKLVVVPDPNEQTTTATTNDGNKATNSEQPSSDDKYRQNFVSAMDPSQALSLGGEQDGQNEAMAPGNDENSVLPLYQDIEAEAREQANTEQQANGEQTDREQSNDDKEDGEEVKDSSDIVDRTSADNDDTENAAFPYRNKKDYSEATNSVEPNDGLNTNNEFMQASNDGRPNQKLAEAFRRWRQSLRNKKPARTIASPKDKKLINDLVMNPSVMEQIINLLSDTNSFDSPPPVAAQSSADDLENNSPDGAFVNRFKRSGDWVYDDLSDLGLEVENIKASDDVDGAVHDEDKFKIETEVNTIRSNDDTSVGTQDKVYDDDTATEESDDENPFKYLDNRGINDVIPPPIYLPAGFNFSVERRGNDESSNIKTINDDSAIEIAGNDDGVAVEDDMNGGSVSYDRSLENIRAVAIHTKYARVARNRGTGYVNETWELPIANNIADNDIETPELKNKVDGSIVDEETATDEERGWKNEINDNLPPKHGPADIKRGDGILKIDAKEDGAANSDIKMPPGNEMDDITVEDENDANGPAKSDDKASSGAVVNGNYSIFATRIRVTKEVNLTMPFDTKDKLANSRIEKVQVDDDVIVGKDDEEHTFEIYDQPSKSDVKNVPEPAIQKNYGPVRRVKLYTEKATANDANSSTKPPMKKVDDGTKPSMKIVDGGTTGYEEAKKIFGSVEFGNLRLKRGVNDDIPPKYLSVPVNGMMTAGFRKNGVDLVYTTSLRQFNENIKILSGTVEKCVADTWSYTKYATSRFNIYPESERLYAIVKYCAVQQYGTNNYQNMIEYNKFVKPKLSMMTVYRRMIFCHQGIST